MLQEMKGLMREKDLCVLATASNNRPHCSLMAYAADDECTELYMATLRQSKKYRNLKENPLVSLLIDAREEDAPPRKFQARALTISGLFQEIQEPTRRELARAKLLQKHPHLIEFLGRTDTEVFCITVQSFLMLEGITEAHFETVE
jgi:nitroimidazol reductase NimA-like FMN-containing flavoprotein (pyridoxamine 5'-phosphate oxidase superfamily)